MYTIKIIDFRTDEIKQSGEYETKRAAIRELKKDYETAKKCYRHISNLTEFWPNNPGYYVFNMFSVEVAIKV